MEGAARVTAPSVFTFLSHRAFREKRRTLSPALQAACAEGDTNSATCSLRSRGFLATKLFLFTEGSTMAGPTQGASSSPPLPAATGPATQPRPASAAPATDKPLPGNVTSGNLAQCKIDPDTSETIVKDLRELRQADTAHCAARNKQNNKNDGKTWGGVDNALERAVGAYNKLNEHVRGALLKCLPATNRSRDAIERAAAQMRATGPQDAGFSEAVLRAERDLLNELPEQRAALIVTGAESNLSYRKFAALSEAYEKSPALQSAIRQNHAYKTIIGDEARKCFPDQLSPDYIPSVLTHVLGVLASPDLNIDLKRDFLQSAAQYAEGSVRIPFLAAEIKRIGDIVLSRGP